MLNFVPVARVAAVRRFNHFYIARADLLGDRHQGSAFSLGEGRLLFELAHGDAPTATQLCSVLRLDAGYVSRVLRDFRRRGLVSRTTSPTDKRESLLSLTAKGRAAFAPLEAGAAARMKKMLGVLAPSAQQEVIRAMQTIEAALTQPVAGDTIANPRAGAGGPAAARRRASEVATPRLRASITLRRHRPGDLGWVASRHGALYAKEYGYDHRFEGLVASVIGEFVANFDHTRERCWIAELDGTPVGSVFLVKKSEAVAKLRLLLIEPSARGYGIGKKLVRTCTTFARSRGYEAIELWTQSDLYAARVIYTREGYQLVGSEAHSMFGPVGVAETWRLELTPADAPSCRPA